MCECTKTTDTIFKNNTDPIPHLHQCTDTQMRRTCRPKKSFIKEVEILHLFLLKPIFYYKLIIDYNLNLIT